MNMLVQSPSECSLRMVSKSGVIDHRVPRFFDRITLAVDHDCVLLDQDICNNISAYFLIDFIGLSD